MQQDSIQKAGSVLIKELKIITSENIIFDISDFLIELNLFEDIFSSYLKGNLVLTDSRNLIELGPLIGEEYLILKLQTPTFNQIISKTFRIYKVSDRTVIRDNNTQNFILHFASIELFYDILLPLFIPFEGTVHEVAGKIFSDYIASNRDWQISTSNNSIKELEYTTPLTVLNATSNKVKFISPGWTPFKCINWLASKAIPKDLKAKNYLFFESNKSFYFGSVEYIYKEAIENNLLIGKYFIAASNIRDGAISPDINREYFIAKDVIMLETTDHIKNYTNGYLANRLITLDLYNKRFDITDYDYVSQYKEQFHTSGAGASATPVFTKDSLRNFTSDISFYPVQPKLYDNFSDNINEKYKEIYGNRKSSLLDLNNIRMNITIPGRTDVEVGHMLYFSYPALGNADESTNEKEDKQYSGYYLITAIHHKVNKIEHTMTMEIIKDSLTLGR